MLEFRRVGWGIGYVVLAALGGYGIGAGAGSAGVLLGASLLAMIGVAGLVMVAFVPWHRRHRPGPVLAVAPSGAPATFFRRSSFRLVCSLVFSLALAGWTGALAVVLYRHEYPVVALVAAGLVAVLLWPVVVAARGKVSPGGLWLTPFGVEHRHDAVSWEVSWADLIGAQPGSSRHVLPFVARRGAVPVEPVRLGLQADVLPAPRRSARWVWDREIRNAGVDAAGLDTLIVEAADLAGGAAQIAEAIRHHLAYPRLRAQLGTARSLPRRNCSCHPEPLLQYSV